MLAFVMIQKVLVNRFPARESFLRPVPVSDLSLVQLPAQINFLAAEQGREVRQPLIQVLYQHAGLLKLAQ